MIELFIIVILPIIMDFIFGDPAKIPHPIIYIGKLIKLLENLIRKSGINLRVGGFFLLLLSLVLVIMPINFLLNILKYNFLYYIFIIYFSYTMLATKSLKRESEKVYLALEDEDVLKARTLINFLVGRDTEKLNEEEIIKATIETISENIIDASIAPIFYLVLGFILGYPLEFIVAYKIVNTLDSMVGYKDEKYEQIGFFSAKLDDVLNFIPARLGSIFILLAGILLKLDFKNGLRIFLRDRLNHNSPNSAHSESVVAGLLNISLGGSNIYFGKLVEKPSIGDELITVKKTMINEVNKLLYYSVYIFSLIIIIIAFLFNLLYN